MNNIKNLLDIKLLNILNEKIKKANLFLCDANVNFIFSRFDKHFIDRINDRSIDNIEIINVISFLLSNKLHEICTGIITNSEFNKLTIQYDEYFFIHATCYRDNVFKIKLRTVIPYRNNYIIGDSIYIKINKLKRNVDRNI